MRKFISSLPKGSLSLFISKQALTSMLIPVLFCMMSWYNSTAQTTKTVSQETYSRVEVKATAAQFAKMNAELGFDHVHFDAKKGFFTGEFSQSEIAVIAKLGGKVKVLIPDIIQNLLQNNSAKLSSGQSALQLPDGFSYGSMGGYLTFAEISAKLDSLRSMYPNLISIKQSIGKSAENRDLWVVKISDNPDIDENEPKVFYNALTHAREPAGMMELMYYMCYLLQNYNINPEVKHLVDNRELYFEPCVNPDGYEYNRSIAPTGGGMWRKNRYKVSNTTTAVSNCHNVTTKTCDTTWKVTTTYTLANCVSTVVKKCDTTWKSPTVYTVSCHNITIKDCDTVWKTTRTFTVRNCISKTVVVCDTTRTTTSTVYGVDLNRNYGYKWGYDNTGSSATQTSDTYRGPFAFSEPEIKAIKDFSELKKFKGVFNQHTYANAATYPFSYKDGVVNADQALYDLRSKLVTEDNNFTIGHMLQTCGYLANGEASDWQYGEQTTKPKAFSWSPELGGSSDGFWPVKTRIEPLCLSMMKMNTNLAWIAGEYYRFSAPTGLVANTNTLSVPVSIINYGDATGSVETIRFISNDTIGTGNNSISLDGIVPGMTAVRNLSLDLSNYKDSGMVSGVLRLTYPDGYTFDMPFSFSYSFPPVSGERKASVKPVIPVSYQLFPNPVNNILSFTSNSYETPVSISVYNLNGELLKKVSNESKVDLSEFPSGMYQVLIETVNGMLQNKVIKQ